MGAQQQTKLMTVQEVAKWLNASQSFVYQLLASGELRHYRLGKGQGGCRVSDEQLLEYLQQKERGGEEDEPTSEVRFIK